MAKSKSKPKSTGIALTGKELRFAAKNQIQVFYEETYHNPHDRRMNFKSAVVMKKAKIGYYIGDSDIDPADFKNSDSVSGEFPEGTFRVCGIAGETYKS